MTSEIRQFLHGTKLTRSADNKIEYADAVSYLSSRLVSLHKISFVQLYRRHVEELELEISTLNRQCKQTSQEIQQIQNDIMETEASLSSIREEQMQTREDSDPHR